MPILDLSQSNAKIYSVQELNQHSRLVLEGHFGVVKVEGEISNLATPRSGHCYFTLKDSAAQIRCAFFKGHRAQSKVLPEDGLKVTVSARVSLFEGRGDYQLIVERIEQSLEGDLKRQFERLKERLSAEGLFDAVHKKVLPLLPKTIGVISSSTGAALQDILSTLKTRAPYAKVIVYPVQVQGEQAKEQIAAMIKTANQRAECDVLILARGGGSLEDLWPFNELIVATEIFASFIPIISGVGHETDTTISDFVADYRAETPTAAAVKATLSKSELEALIKTHKKHLARQMIHTLTLLEGRLKHLLAKLTLPRGLFNQRTLKLESLNQKLLHFTNNAWQKNQHRLIKLTTRLNKQNPNTKLIEQKNRLEKLSQELMQKEHEKLKTHKNRLHQLLKTLNVLSPLNTLERGYALALNKNKVLISHCDDVAINEPLTIKLKDGELSTIVSGIHKG